MGSETSGAGLWRKSVERRPVAGLATLIGKPVRVTFKDADMDWEAYSVVGVDTAAGWIGLKGRDDDGARYVGAERSYWCPLKAIVGIEEEKAS
jgi:hypothetical protein